MKTVFSVLFVMSVMSIHAQKQTFDLVSFTAPAGWKKQVTEQSLQLMTEDTAKGTYCIMMLFKALPGGKDAKANFDAAWETVVKGMVTISTPPEMQPAAVEDGWEAQSGYASYQLEGTQGMAILVTSTGFDKMVNILVLTNTDAYQTEMAAFFESVKLSKPAGSSAPVSNTSTHTPPVTATNNDGYTYSTTNFDDGWTSTVQGDWVEVTKGNIKVLLHYPKEGTVIQADPEPFTNNAWNILVAPRYRDLKGYKVVSPMDYQRGYLGAGSVTDVKTGKQLYVALFRKGGSGWMEFICPDKNTFVQFFGADVDAIRWDTDAKVFDRMLKMEYYNRFAVAASDFKGTWTSDFTGMQQLYHVYTGNYAGMNINQSNETFVFGAGGNYQWNILVVNGMVGNMKYAQAKSSGQLTVLSNWQVKCSDIEGNSKIYNAFFSCIKGARLLHLLDAQFPGSGIPTIYGKK